MKESRKADRSKNKLKNLKYIVPVLIVLGILTLLGLVYIAATRNLTSLESVFLQIISLAIGGSVSLFAGRQSVREAAREIIKPHARSAFRRLISLYRSLQRTATVIESSQSAESDEDYQVGFAKLDAIVTEQLAAADDALEDWNDLVEKEVEELKQKLESDNTTEDRP